MDKPLVVVESPTKVKTLKKYLGNDFNVVATVGHIKDLPQKEIGIDIEKGFKPKYLSIPGKKKIITQLKKAAGDTHEIFLAPDPDREGEAIAWHTAEVLKKRGRVFHRVLFHELTEKAIREAMSVPQELHKNRFEAQQARRILDRLVGYQVSPLLWRKVKGGLSAGRVQSVAVRIICEREKEIQAFIPKEYWTITATLEAQAPPRFDAKLNKKNGKKITIPDKAAADDILKELVQASPVVSKIDKKTVRKNPAAPFTTSKLQQDAIRKLHFSSKKTMTIAQQLYEGLELEGGEPVGLITYMRTDSVRISNDSAMEALDYIRRQFGKDYALDKPRFFKNRKKAQDAHEAIRPTSVENTPDAVAKYLSKDQLALYQLIWQRFVASQMARALINQISVIISIGKYDFNASGSSVKFPGFLVLYKSEDEGEDKAAKEKNQLPDLQEAMVLKLISYDPKQHFTQPPPRYSEASLVKELEENGIGRPSTYATILSTIREKGYVELLKGYFHPTELGLIVSDLLVANFPEVFNVEFTSKMEDSLDRLESAETDSLKVLNSFYTPFKKDLDQATDGMLSLKGVGVSTNLKCPECNAPLRIKVGKNGPFLACSGYPECTYSCDYVRDEKGQVKPVEPVVLIKEEKTCPKCGKPMVVKQGKYGPFMACSGYPKCKHTESLSPKESGKTTGVKCPETDCDGELIQKKSKRGKIFYGCSRFPDCTYALWNKPVPKPCPVCGSTFLVEKTTKKDGTFLTCPNKECGYKETPDTEEKDN